VHRISSPANYSDEETALLAFPKEKERTAWASRALCSWRTNPKKKKGTGRRPVLADLQFLYKSNCDGEEREKRERGGKGLSLFTTKLPYVIMNYDKGGSPFTII